MQEKIEDTIFNTLLVLSLHFTATSVYVLTFEADEQQIFYFTVLKVYFN